jgi:ribosome maturation factor RimP
LLPVMEPSVDQTLEGQIRALARPILSSLGLELVDIEQAHGGKRALVRIFIDKAGGVSLKDCADASTYLGHALDVEDAIPYAYTLEVSSPGLDRPLKKVDDYHRAVGKAIRIKFVEAVGGQWVITGRLREVRPDAVIVEPEDSELQVIHFGNIKQARLEVEW